MISRINRTGRKRILKRDIDLKLRATDSEGAPIFDLALRLGSYGFPADAYVRVEASRVHAVQRWDYGTVGTVRQPAEDDRRLTDVPPSARFRVLVVAADGSGKLLGHAPNLRPERPRHSLLPLEERDDLGEVVWRVDFDDEDGNPVLFVNGNVAGISETVRHDPVFRSLVMPEVFRTILQRMMLIDGAAPDDADGPWADWFGVARTYLPTMAPPAPTVRGGASEASDAHDAHQWIDAVVAALAKKPLNAATAFENARS